MDPKLEALARLYTESLQQHGAVPKGVGWGNEDSHHLRFDKLMSVIEPSGEGASVNDLGCGYGAFYQHLLARGVKVSRYHGCDISTAMLAEARRLIGGREVELVEGADLGQSADYSFASGIFNVRMEASDEAWHEHILQTLDMLFERSEKGFAFNLLTSYVDWKESHLFYGDPAIYFEHCKRRYSRYVSLLHDYPLWEWTIIVRRAGSLDCKGEKI